MAKRVIFRDYRPGKGGRFASRATFERSKAHGGSKIKQQEIEVTVERDEGGRFITPVDSDLEIDSVEDFEEYEDYEDLVDYDFHGTGDTGKQKKK